MVNFVAQIDFETKPYQLEGLADLGTAFDDFVTDAQRKVLLKMLGETLYDAFDTGLGQAGPPQRWKDLRDGKTYPLYNRNYKWEGMNTMLRPYIYAMWLLEQATNVTTTGGVVSSNAENATTVNSAVRVSRAYSDFAKFAQNGRYSLDALRSWFSQSRILGNQGSLFGYLYSSDQTYVADIAVEDSDILSYLYNHFECLGRMNDFDL